MTFIVLISWSRGRSGQVQKCTFSLPKWVQIIMHRAPHSPPECKILSKCQWSRYNIKYLAFRWGKGALNWVDSLLAQFGSTSHGDDHQVLRPTLSFHASHCWALPPYWCSPNPASGSSRESLCGVSTYEEHAGGGIGRCLGRRGLSEANFALAVPAPELMQPQPSLRVV